jgi:kynurenine formamidase
MIYDLSQPIVNNVPPWPNFQPASIRRFAAFPVFDRKSSAARTRNIDWDEGEMA